MRISDDTRKTVVFLGVLSIDGSGQEKFTGAGTGFFLHHDGWSHLVTCRHVAKQLEGTPFVVRGNSRAGKVIHCHIDRIEWFYHPDETVDVAVLPCGMPDEADWLVMPSEMVLDEDRRKQWGIGPGDFAYVIGLFRLLHGEGRNLPIVHSGNIARLPEDEKIPVVDRITKKRIDVEGYLVEIHSLDGLSGSPVFARVTISMQERGSVTLRGGSAPVKEESPIYGGGRFFLLGMWQGAWEGEPTEPLVASHRGPVLVPLGLGVVVPAFKIVEALSMPDVAKDRKMKMEISKALSAAVTNAAPPTKGENPQHREDFNRLLDAVARGSKPSPGKA